MSVFFDLEDWKKMDYLFSICKDLYKEFEI